MALQYFEFNLGDDQALGGVTTFTTAVCDLRRTNKQVSLAFKHSSPTVTPQAKIQLATSRDGVNFDAYADTANLMSNIANTFVNNTNGWNRVTVPNIDNEYVRFRFTGLTGNPADALISVRLICAEELPGRLRGF